MSIWLDLAVVRYPNCGSPHVGVFRFLIELESDIQCGRNLMEFNRKENTTDRLLLEFEMDGEMKMQSTPCRKSPIRKAFLGITAKTPFSNL